MTGLRVDASVTFTLKVSPPSLKPASNPPDKGVQGASNDDWVTECWIELYISFIRIVHDERRLAVLTWRIQR